MTESLETKLHSFLKSNFGKHFSYNEIKYMVENVWKTPKGAHYRMTTLERRWRHDKYKTQDISDRIGRVYKNGAIIELYYISDSEVKELTQGAKEFLAKWGPPAYKPESKDLKLF